MSLPGPQDQWDKVYYIFGSNDFNIRVWGSFLVSFLTFLGIGGLFTFVDLTGRPQCMSKYKVQDGVKSYPISKTQLFDVIKVTAINQLLVIPLLMLIFYFDKWRGVIIAQELPSVLGALYHLLVFVAVIEIAFYYLHRLLHHPYLYKRIHKKHHTWISPIAISATYCHPIEHIFSNLTPVALGPLLLSSHTILWWSWIAISTTSTLIVHSGYHLPCLTSPEFHDFHHLKFNYNYGVVGILDYLHGTDSLFRKSKQFVRHKSVWTTTPVKEIFP